MSRNTCDDESCAKNHRFVYEFVFTNSPPGHVSVPDFASGAMENWGLILYRDYNLLYDPQASTALHEQRVITIIAHEIAHQVRFTNRCDLYAFINTFWAAFY